jgi:hypothetical protein
MQKKANVEHVSWPHHQKLRSLPSLSVRLRHGIGLEKRRDTTGSNLAEGLDKGAQELPISR